MSVADREPIAAVDDSGPMHAWPNLPRMIDVAGMPSPQSPLDLAETGVEPQVLYDLALKLASSAPSLNTQWAAQQLRLPVQLVDEMFWKLKQDQLLDIQGQSGAFGYRYAITRRGSEYAQRLLDVSGYIGPAPVSLAAYTAMMEWQVSRRRRVSLADVRGCVDQLVLPDDAVKVAALAVSSGRSLFLFGPAGNGKTSLGQLLHHAISGDMWVPHCVSIDHHIIRMYDPYCHQLSEPAAERSGLVDERWLQIRRPLVVAGGEMTVDELDLQYHPALRYYEAPPHVKANGGTFLIDDFGRQRIEPHELLNRWIIPLEHQSDYLTLHNGQKIRFPFRLMLIVATNLNVSEVVDPAFLRRVGYRLHLDRPTPGQYTRIFEQYAARVNVAVPSGLIAQILERYRTENRDLRASEPRDIIERVRDIANLRGRSFELTSEMIHLAWTGYFGMGSNCTL